MSFRVNNRELHIRCNVSWEKTYKTEENARRAALKFLKGRRLNWNFFIMQDTAAFRRYEEIRFKPVFMEANLHRDIVNGFSVIKAYRGK